MNHPKAESRPTTDTNESTDNSATSYCFQFCTLKGKQGDHARVKEGDPPEVRKADPLNLGGGTPKVREGDPAWG